jgi:uncharacterized membrane protein
MLAICGLCAYPAMTASIPDDPGLEHYEARGNEPGWGLVIHARSMDYVGPGGAGTISAERPDPRPAINGRRYITDRLTVDVTYSRCNDDLSGRGYEHQVLVTAGGETHRGCGGARRSDWDV